MTQLTPSGVTASSTYANSAAFAPGNVIDGNTATLAASNLLTATSGDQWISVQMPAGSRIGYVAVYNRDDYAWATAMLNPYEIWLTATPGTVTTAPVSRVAGLVTPCAVLPLIPGSVSDTMSVMEVGTLI